MDTKSKSLTNIDLINGPIFKSLVLFAIPMLISNIFQQFYNTADTMIVGHYLGDNSLAAIGACGPVYEMIVGFALGIGSGFSIVIARFFGSGDMDKLKKSVASTMIIGLFVSIFMTILAQVSIKPLLRLLNTPTDIINESYSYISTITLFIIVMFAYNMCSGLLRAIGNSVMPLVFLIISACTNVILDIVFIAKFDIGIRGAAIATVISQGLSVVLCFIYIIKKAKILIPLKEHFKLNKNICVELITQGLSMGFMSCIVSAGSVILQYGINGLGKAVIAGHVAARKLYMFSIMPVVSLGFAVSTFVSQNRGAGKRDRIIKCVKSIYLYCTISTVIVSILIYFLAPHMIKIISGSSNPTIIENGTLYLRCCSPFFAVLGILTCTRNSLQALGQKIQPIVGSIIEFIGKIVFVVLLIPKFDYIAVIFCEPVIWCVMAIQLVIAFFTDPYIRNKSKA